MLLLKNQVIKVTTNSNSHLLVFTRTYIIGGEKAQVAKAAKPHKEVTQAQEEGANIPRVQITLVALGQKGVLVIAGTRTLHRVTNCTYNFRKCNGSRPDVQYRTSSPIKGLRRERL